VLEIIKRRVSAAELDESTSLRTTLNVNAPNAPDLVFEYPDASNRMYGGVAAPDPFAVIER